MTTSARPGATRCAALTVGAPATGRARVPGFANAGDDTIMVAPDDVRSAHAEFLQCVRRSTTSPSGRVPGREVSPRGLELART